MAKLQFKVRTNNSFTWKRVARNQMRFGWVLGEAEETITTTYEYKVEDVEEIDDQGDKVTVEEYYGRLNTYQISEGKYKTTITDVHEKTKSWVSMSFYRQPDDFENLEDIRVIEIIYNIIYLCRFLLGTILPAIFPFLFVAAVIFASLPYSHAMEPGGFLANIISAYVVGIFLWVFFVLAETVLARIAAKKLIIKIK